MTMIYDPKPFVKLVQKFLVGKYEPLMGICGKIFIFNLHNVQKLFMLWIKYKFSECLDPCTKMKVPNGRLSGDSSAQACRHRGTFGDSNTQIFSVPTEICCAHKNLF